MRVIETDNFGGNYVNERFACPYYFNHEEALKVANLFNELMSGDNALRYWRVVPNNYILIPGLEILRERIQEEVVDCLTLKQNQINKIKELGKKIRVLEKQFGLE